MNGGAAPWHVATIRGPAASLHATLPAPTPVRSATWCEVDRAALVLGSSQPESSIDVEACLAAGVDVARRRSGGGSVLIIPGEMLWLDVVVPAGDPLWDDDVGRSMWWLGEVWAAALEMCGIARAQVYRGSIQHSEWSRSVCFDGLGAGEVVVGSAKAVGISQRRTRSWIRLQSSIHLAWRPELVVALLADPRPGVTELLEPFVADVAPARLAAAVEECLARTASIGR